MTVQEFIDKYNNRWVDFDGWWGAQCCDLFQFYNRDIVGGDFVWGVGAADIWDTYPKNLYKEFWNTPDFIPQLGDVVIWEKNASPWGHIALVLEADINKFKALSQNDPADSKVHIKEYNYDHVIGFLRPKIFINSIPNNMTDLEIKKVVQFDRATIVLHEAGLIPTSASEYFFENPADEDKFTNQIKTLIRDAKPQIDCEDKLAKQKAECEKQLDELSANFKSKLLELIQSF